MHDMDGSHAFGFKRLVGMKRKRNRGLIHVYDVAWISPSNVGPHKFDEMGGLLLSFFEVFLHSVSSRTIRQAQFLSETPNSCVLCLKSFVPE